MAPDLRKWQQALDEIERDLARKELNLPPDTQLP
jgi:hypothetical protein